MQSEDKPSLVDSEETDEDMPSLVDSKEIDKLFYDQIPYHFKIGPRRDLYKEERKKMMEMKKEKEMKMKTLEVWKQLRKQYSEIFEKIDVLFKPVPDEAEGEGRAVQPVQANSSSSNMFPDVD